MVRVGWSRVVFGGLAAGVVINVCEYVLNGVVLAQRWADALRALNRPGQFNLLQLGAMNLWGFLMGIAAVWLYASIRDHYGPGLRTAVYAGLAVWAIGYGFGSIPSAVMQMFPVSLVAYGVVAGAVESVGGAVLGAWIYRPPVEASQQAAG